MNPQDRQAQWEARNAAMRQQVDSLLAGLNRQTAALTSAQAQAAEVTGRAASADGLVRATVNAAGVVTDVQFAPTAFTRSTPDKLARSVVEVIQQAAADARRKVEAVLAPVRENLPDLPDAFAPDVIRGVPALKDLLPATKQPPRAQDDDEDFSNGSVLWGGNR